MPRCASAASLACLLLAGCGDSATAHGFSIRDAQLSVQRGRLDVRLSQDLVFSTEAIEALDHGVPLTVSVELELRNQDTLNLLANQRRSFEIRYLPLSQHYRLSAPEAGSARTFPRLRHAVNALANLDLELPTGPLTPGEYLLRCRVVLDQATLPGPMQLPAALSTAWRHESEWSQWPFRISA